MIERNKKSRFVFVVITILVILYIGKDAQAATINSSSCSQPDVQSAINAAVSGDTVTVPACPNTTWNAGVTISGKGITLLGAGEDVTNILNGMTSGSLVSVSTDAIKNTRISGFTFKDLHTFSLDIDGRYFIFISINGEENNALFRVDHNKFISNCSSTQPNSVMIMIDIGGAYGLLDNNSFSSGVELIHVQGSGDGNAAWSAPDNAGTDRNVYIEDNDFHQDCVWNISGTNYIGGTTIVQGYRGGRYVVRHNQIYFMGIDAHGWAPAIQRRGTRWYEIYDNTFSTPADANAFAFFQMRGGSGVIFNNALNCGGNSICGGIQLTDESYMVPESPHCTDYPCQDQIGRGQNMGSSPLYSWNNTDLDTYVGNGADNIIQVDRDYYLSQKPGYIPYVYPHPLTIELNPDTSVPNAPSNLSVM